ncbi:tRNA (adenosine(37)-N6)-threonylcarbamoyltransferase complex ATPase subunit type 1 TsaE [Pseudanabaena sp. FACHB-1998]|uniref:tRNA (adenosine(37)-N6)-threonylcarbamoyltransferase complex ATPase subunit type 1 TsaE n=1 Tax=Pseudanabaena sp. FACHB-1998 TaxID=2692858 RepID=UPI0016809466|nr:tRNA (adenosine(37)-N6)-threonylcarbamoyltransferase complex ATPase subunit type 1 TsaE [Pseudanabaena sp. FACHB-1998]MBD2178779.1 tRNA (adenosine(37)-N6)-threonylcarbamoyltransferase complex ATPase subunit type 1 TsaE [Pseudanabaena sp. FACHB-1998]
MTETVKIDIYANNLVATQAIATQLAQLVSAGTIILLEGNLGSGKTTFIQAFGKSLGIHTTIASPTFTLIDEYTEGRLPLYHIDLYRLERSQVASLHLEEYWRGEDFPLGVVAIEWASKLSNLPPEYLNINLAVVEESLAPQQIQTPLTEISPQHQLAIPSLSDLEGEGDLDQDLAEDFPETRLIELIAHGETYIKLLECFKFSQ